MSSTLTFQCPDKPSTVTERNVCDTALCQADGTGCFNTTRPADKDFGQAAAMMEASREAGVYGLKDGSVEIFKGFMEECSVKTIGGSSIKSCCASAGGGAGFTNYAVLGLTAKAAYAAGKEEIKAGSKYVYDALFQSQDASLIQDGMGAVAGGLSDGAAEGVASQAGTNFGTYGFEFSYSSAGGFEFVGFDPYSFAFAVAVAIVTEWLSCDQEEQVMQMKRGQNLCVYISSYCSSKILGVCVEKKERHCCFNSVLAKLINRQGRQQLGMPMEQCGGFNQAQLQALDFSRIDLSEFIATIVPRDVNSGELKGPVSDTVNKKVSDFYGN
jgi:conjugal transfer mating pair stabilization protein TraN